MKNLFLYWVDIDQQPFEIVSNAWHNIMQEHFIVAPQSCADSLFVTVRQCLMSDEEYLERISWLFTDEHEDYESSTSDNLPMYVYHYDVPNEILEYSPLINGKRTLICTHKAKESSPYNHVLWVD